MVAPTVYFEYHHDEEVSQFIFIPKTTTADGSLTVPHLFSRTITPSNPQRAYQRTMGKPEAVSPSYTSSIAVATPHAAAVKAAPTLNDLMAPVTLILGDARQKLYETPIVVFISDAEIEELVDQGTCPRTLRDRVDRTRSSLGWKDLPKRSN